MVVMFGGKFALGVQVVQSFEAWGFRNHSRLVRGCPERLRDASLFFSGSESTVYFAFSRGQSSFCR